MIRISRLNAREPEVYGSQCYDADAREWVPASEATEFESVDEAIKVVARDGLIDVKIYDE